MAIFRIDITSVGRSAGRRATAAAAYRAGERIRDLRTGHLYNHANRRDIAYKEILLPSRLRATEASWARDRATLWNAAEYAENRRDSRVAREFQVALPSELSAAQRVELARQFSCHVADHYNVAVDLCVHNPRPTGDPRNFHAHLLATPREINAAGLGAKVGLELGKRTRFELGLGTSRDEYLRLREQWATLTNQALESAQVHARVDHRTLEAQGIIHLPRARIPWASYRLEQQGIRSEIADRVRERYRTFVLARRERHAELVARPKRDYQQLSELRRLARENWLKFRQAMKDKNTDLAWELASSHERTVKGKDHDFSL